jgi:hypothetical protein
MARVRTHIHCSIRICQSTLVTINSQTSRHLFSYTYKQRRVLLYEEWNAPEVWKYGIWY